MQWQNILYLTQPGVRLSNLYNVVTNACLNYATFHEADLIMPFSTVHTSAQRKMKAFRVHKLSSFVPKGSPCDNVHLFTFDNNNLYSFVAAH